MNAPETRGTAQEVQSRVAANDVQDLAPTPPSNQAIQPFTRADANAQAFIRDARLYRESHATFEDYCRGRWDISKTRAYELSGAVERRKGAESSPRDRSETTLADAVDGVIDAMRSGEPENAACDAATIAMCVLRRRKMGTSPERFADCLKKLLGAIAEGGSR